MIAGIFNEQSDTNNYLKLIRQSGHTQLWLVSANGDQLACILTILDEGVLQLYEISKYHKSGLQLNRNDFIQIDYPSIDKL